MSNFILSHADPAFIAFIALTFIASKLIYTAAKCGFANAITNEEKLIATKNLNLAILNKKLMPAIPLIILCLKIIVFYG